MVLAILSFGFASSRAFSISGIQSIPVTIVALVALHETYAFLPPATQNRTFQALLGVLGLTIVVGGQYCSNGLGSTQWPSFSFPGSPVVGNHPIEDTVHETRAYFSAMLERQSKSFRKLSKGRNEGITGRLHQGSTSGTKWLSKSTRH